MSERLPLEPLLEDDKFLEEFSEWASQFALINIGGKYLYLDLRRNDPLSSPMKQDDFIRGQSQDDTFTYWNRLLHKAPILAKFKPPSFKLYHGGPVFKPNLDEASDEFNIFKGWRVKPDPSGKCDLLYDGILKDIWCGHNPASSLWCQEWLWHILKFPGEKVGTSTAIRGPSGAGKSIVFDMLQKIMGDSIVVVSQEESITGGFNGLIKGRLLVVLEEAAFAGSKKTFEHMKNLITGRSIVINEKHIPHYTMANHARLALLSNRDHIAHLEQDDRRYTVLAASDKRVGDMSWFEAVSAEWENGGAERFLYDALNHQFRVLDGTNAVLAINTPIQTEAKVEQKAESRSCLERAIVEILTRGTLKTSVQFAIHLEKHKSTEIHSQTLLDMFREWMAGEDREEAKRVSVDKIMDGIGRYLGERPTRMPRTKIIRDSVRTSGPTTWKVPPRAFLKHALEKQLITGEEYNEAGFEEEKDFRSEETHSSTSNVVNFSDFFGPATEEMKAFLKRGSEERE